MPEHLYFVKAPPIGFQRVAMVKDDYLAQTTYAGNSIVANVKKKKAMISFKKLKELLFPLPP